MRHAPCTSGSASVISLCQWGAPSGRCRRRRRESEDGVGGSRRMESEGVSRSVRGRFFIVFVPFRSFLGRFRRLSVIFVVWGGRLGSVHFSVVSVVSRSFLPSTYVSRSFLPSTYVSWTTRTPVLNWLIGYCSQYRETFSGMRLSDEPEQEYYCQFNRYY